jgi:hypothetical protein
MPSRKLAPPPGFTEDLSACSEADLDPQKLAAARRKRARAIAMQPLQAVIMTLFTYFLMTRRRRKVVVPAGAAHASAFTFLIFFFQLQTSCKAFAGAHGRFRWLRMPFWSLMPFLAVHCGLLAARMLVVLRQ